MNDNRSILFGGLAVLVAIFVVIGFALYNEGVIGQKIYKNTLFGYELNIPFGYQLGVPYMAYLDGTDHSSIRVSSSTEYLASEAEIVVLTKQDKSSQERYVEWLKTNPALNLEQVCECVVLSAHLLPEPMSQLVRERDVKNGKLGTSTDIVTNNNQNIPVYTNELAEVYIDLNNQLAQKPISRERHIANVFFTNPKDFPLENDFLPDQTITVYGLTLSMFTPDSSESVSLADIINGLKL